MVRASPVEYLNSPLLACPLAHEPYRPYLSIGLTCSHLCNSTQSDQNQNQRIASHWWQNGGRRKVEMAWHGVARRDARARISSNFGSLRGKRRRRAAAGPKLLYFAH
uniref:Uncharacterized protein n=1 Tax=Caenorhabditis japonica TaxID=281687 RepID=A0A8R1ISG6_CAEJA